MKPMIEHVKGCIKCKKGEEECEESLLIISSYSNEQLIEAFVVDYDDELKQKRKSYQREYYKKYMTAEFVRNKINGKSSF